MSRKHNYPKEKFSTEGTCKTEGCETKIFSRLLCRKHYDQQDRKRVYNCLDCGRETRQGNLCSGCWQKANAKPCTIEDCERLTQSKGLCATHYKRLQVHGTTDKVYVKREPKSVMARFFKFVDVQEDGCWKWTGSLSNVGYSRFASEYGTYGHQAAYNLFVGPIPAGLTIDHLCMVRKCVNPQHLEAVTLRENIMRSPNQVCAINARKTHCKQGHEFNEENTYRNTKGRVCKTCRRQATADFKQRQQAAA